MSKFTKGPWKLTTKEADSSDPMGLHRFTIRQVNGTNEVIATTVKEYDSVDDHANGLLLAAAPSMLELLEDINMWDGLSTRQHSRIEHMISRAKGE